MKVSSTTEEGLRDEIVPTTDSLQELSEYIDSLVSLNHDYGTCAYAMSMASVAAFNFVASKLGVTGFQASCADLDAFKRMRHIDGPFMILKGKDALYPQYDLHRNLEEALEEWKPWLKEEAVKLLKEEEKYEAHPAVKAHWEKLSNMEVKEKSL